MSNTSTVVGSKIKSIRESKLISIEDIAERSGLSVDQIKSIENDQFLPSLGPLIKIARALGVRLGTFLDDNDELGPVVCRAAERDSSISFSNGTTDARKHMEYHSLAKQKMGRHMYVSHSISELRATSIGSARSLATIRACAASSGVRNTMSTSYGSGRAPTTDAFTRGPSMLSDVTCPDSA